MIVRLVKMHFKAEELPKFLAHFDQHKERIRQFEGCTYLQILQDPNDPSCLFSHSHWRDEAALEAYRQSDFFQGVWAFTKTLFDARPEAWSLQVYAEFP